jgi:hypothetical protein
MQIIHSIQRCLEEFLLLSPLSLMVLAGRLPQCFRRHRWRFAVTLAFKEFLSPPLAHVLGLPVFGEA